MLANVTIVGSMSVMRLKLEELLEERGLTPYAAAKKSGDRLDASTLYRLIRNGGRPKFFANDLLEALCDVLDVAPGDLFERDKRPRNRAA